MKRLVLYVFILLLVSCGKVPSYVIDLDDMAAVLADIHVGESVIELNRKDYRTDSLRMLMKQSILDRHGVTPQQFDTSMWWYSHNISQYIELYDKTINNLERRIAETGNRIAAENVSLAGDSVDVWPSARTISFGRRSPSQYITFSLGADDNWEHGDYYTWRGKFINNNDASTWVLAAQYTDGTSEFISSNISGDGWHEINFIADSTRTADRIFGYFKAESRGETTLWVDSLMLIRNRLTPERYRKRFNQTRISPKNPVDTQSLDSVAD